MADYIHVVYVALGPKYSAEAEKNTAVFFSLPEILGIYIPRKFLAMTILQFFFFNCDLVKGRWPTS